MTLKTGIIVQARMGSTRLPGKILKTVLGKPLLGYLFERLSRVKSADSLILATTTQPQDDELVSFCHRNNTHCYRGSEDNVLERYYQTALTHHLDIVVRITSDCPLIDPELIEQLINVFKNNRHNLDYLSNTLERTYPRGMDIEIFSFKALQEVHDLASKPSEYEHVTPYFYQNPDKFRIKNIKNTVDLSKYRLTVDTREDLILISKILEALYPQNPYFSLQDIVDLLRLHPEWAKINQHIEQKKI